MQLTGSKLCLNSEILSDSPTIQGYILQGFCKVKCSKGWLMLEAVGVLMYRADVEQEPSEELSVLCFVHSCSQNWSRTWNRKRRAQAA